MLIWQVKRVVKNKKKQDCIRWTKKAWQKVSLSSEKVKILLFGRDFLTVCDR